MRSFLRLSCVTVLSVVSAVVAGACSDDPEEDQNPQGGPDASSDVTQTPDVVIGDELSTFDQVVPGDADLDGGPKCKTTSCAIAIAAGPNHTCVVLGDRTVRCWGENVHGELGTGAVEGGTVKPPFSAGLQTSEGVTDAIGIACGGEPGATGFTCALLANGSIRCWGSNNAAQLGGAVDGSVSPSGGLVPADASATALDLGYRHGCLIDTAGALRCWGSTGNNERSDAAVLGAVGLPTDAGLAGLSLGYFSICVVSTANEVIFVGLNANGQLNPASAAPRVSPTIIDAGFAAEHVSTTVNFTCASADGGVACWGSNLQAQLGKVGGGTSLSPRSPDFTPGIVPISVTTGGTHACSIMEDRGVACWGANNKGQAGDFTLKNPVTAPTGVGGLSKVVQLALGNEHSCSLNDDGEVYCWGSNTKGQLGPNGNPGTPPTPIDAGDGGDAGFIPGIDAGPDNAAHPDAVKVPL